MYLPMFIYQVHYYISSNLFMLSSATINPEKVDSYVTKETDLWNILQEAWDIIKIAIPVIIIVLSAIDFLVAIAKEEEDMKKAQTRLIKRLVVGIAIFIIPVILEFFFSWTRIGGLNGIGS